LSDFSLVVGAPSPTTDLLEVGGGTPTSREKNRFLNRYKKIFLNIFFQKNL
jgi:hypothetical protein